MILKMPSVLFVCAANMCRSPYAVAKFRAGIEGQGDLDFYVNSAGTHAIFGQEWCPVSVEAGATAGSAQKTAQHIKDVDLFSYDLILASGRAQRSAALQYQPSVRSRLFTMREAALQVEWLTKPGGVLDAVSGVESSFEFDFDIDRIPKLPNAKPSRWNWLVNEMNEWRGFAETIVNATEELDILDPHDSKKEIHAEAFSQIDQSIASLTMGISTVLDR
jgi:protein-tyrosine-phosphatase